MDSVTFIAVKRSWRHPRHLIGASLAVLALGIGLSACGGSDNSSETPAPAVTTTEATVALTTDDLISQGDAICAEVNAALGAIEASTADETTKSGQIAEIYDGLAQRLGDLGTPTDGEPPTEVIAAAQDLADGSSDTAALETAAADYGFTDCAEAPTATSYPGGSTETGSGGTDSTGTYAPPATDTVPDTTTPAPAPPPTTGGGVAPTTPDPGTSTGGSSGGGASSGGIGPG